VGCYNYLVKKKKVYFQSIDFKFPKSVWMVAVWLVPTKERILPMYLHVLKKDKKAAIKYAEEVLVQVKKLRKPAPAIDYLLLVPLTFSHLYPLKKEYWDNPSYEIKSIDKAVLFSEAIAKPWLYHLLVTPGLDEKTKKVELSAAFVFKKGAERDLETFMRTSTHPVSPEAKNAAIYNIGDSFGYDLKKKEEIVNDKNLVN